MANNIANIDVLDKLLKNRYHKVGKDKIEIGNFWSVLQIYLAMKKLNISINTLCKIASKMSGKIDAKYRRDDGEVSVAMMRKYLQLKTTPAHLSHTVITKEVAKGVSKDMTLKVRDVLTQHNSYGPDLLNEIMKCVDLGKGQFISSRINVMGCSPFAQVLKLSLVLTALFNEGIISDMSETPSGDHIETIITIIKENQNAIKEYDTIGFEPIAL